MDNALVRQVVVGDRVPRRAAADRVRNVVKLAGFLNRAGQRVGTEEVAARIHARAAAVDGAPDVHRPVDGAAVAAELRPDADRHRGSDRRGGELVLPEPLHPDRPVRVAKRQEGCVEGRVVSRIVTVTAGSLAMQDSHGGFVEAKGAGEPVAENVHALGMSLHRQPPIAEGGEGEGRADWAVDEVGPSKGILDCRHTLAASRVAFVDDAVTRRLLSQVIDGIASVGYLASAGPDRLLPCGGGRAHDGRLVVPNDPGEVALAAEGDGSVRCLADRRLVERLQMRADPAAVDHARMEDIRGDKVVDKAPAVQLVGQIEPRQALSHVSVFGRPLGRRGPRRLPGETYFAGE
jgi:hypothetical protein